MSDDEERKATQEERRLLDRLAVPPGLCASCEHLRLLASKRSVFVRCGLGGGGSAVSAVSGAAGGGLRGVFAEKGTYDGLTTD